MTLPSIKPVSRVVTKDLRHTGRTIHYVEDNVSNEQHDEEHVS